MYVVTVQFTAQPAHVSDFKTRLVRQAAETLELEPSAHVYDVCFDPDDDMEVFLYQVHESPEAYLAHLEQPHTQNFERDVEPWLSDRVVRTYRRL